MKRIVALLATLGVLSACAGGEMVDEPVKDMGDFVLGHNIVVSPDLMKGPLSREASEEEWIESVQGAVGDRMGRYDGDRLVHLGINVAGYVLAQPGIPVIASPKSALVLLVTTWDDEAGGQYYEEPHQIVVTESISAKGVIGSGLTTSAEEQMANLSYNAAKSIETWLSYHADCMREDMRGEAAVACWAKVDKQLKANNDDAQ